MILFGGSSPTGCTHGEGPYCNIAGQRAEINCKKNLSTPRPKKKRRTKNRTANFPQISNTKRSGKFRSGKNKKIFAGEFRTDELVTEFLHFKELGAGAVWRGKLFRNFLIFWPRISAENYFDRNKVSSGTM